MNPHDRVWQLVEAARRIADPRDPVGIEARKQLVQSTQLSAAGVELALSNHLETKPTTSDINALLSATKPVAQRSKQGERRCHVVLAANVCTAPLRAIACAVAAFDQVTVKPSRRDPVVAECLVQLVNSPTLTLCSELAPAVNDTVHVYGSDDTIATLRQALPPTVMLIGHGTGFGIAVVDGDHDEAAEAVARDLVAFDGQGCLSPRLVVAHDPIAFAEALHQELAAAGAQIPRGTLHSADRHALAQTAQLFRTIGQAWVGPDHAVFVDPEPQAITLAPPFRATVVVGTAAATPAVIGAVSHHVTAIGGAPSEWATVLSRMCPSARRSALGRMQRPPLDGPVDRRAG